MIQIFYLTGLKINILNCFHPQINPVRNWISGISVACVPVQFIKVLYKPSSDRVEVNVAYQFQKIGFLLAQYRFEAVLENVCRENK